MVVGLLAALAGAGQALAQVSIGECFSVDGKTETVFPNDQFVSAGRAIVCKSTGAEIRTSGIQAPENTTVNNVTVTIENGAAIVLSGSTIGLGSNSTVTNRGLLDTRSFFNGHGISAGANGRSEMGENIITNETTGKIITGGRNAVGILINARRAGASGNTITNAGEITTSGNNADGIRLLTTATSAVTNTITNTGTITTGGSTAHGIGVQNATGVINIVNGGSVSSTGSGAHGIYAQGAVDLIVSGTISSLNGDAIRLAGGTGFSNEANIVTLQSGATIIGNIVFDTNKTSEKLVFDGFSGSLSNTITGLNNIDVRTGSVTMGASVYAFGDSTIDVDGTDSSLSISGAVSNSKITKQGAGRLLLSGANSYSGGTEVLAGILALGSDTAAGSGQIVMQGGTRLQANSSISLANDIDLKGAVVFDTQGFDMLIGATVTNAAGGQVIKEGSGTLTLNGTNTYTGGTEVVAGTLALGSDTAAGAGDIVMQSGTTLQASSSLTLDNIVDLKGTVTFDAQSFDMTLNNGVTNAAGGQLIKTGSGTLTLNGTNTYTGGTIIQEGTIALFGTLASSVEVGSGTVFGGTGTVNGDVTNAGTIRPRLNGTRSTLTIVGNYVGQGGVFASTLGGTTEAIEADRLAIQGTGNTASGTTTINVGDPTGVLGQPTVGDGILLVDVSGGATSTPTAFNSPRIAAGAYEYTLVRGGDSSSESWYLRADIEEPQPPVVVTPQAAQREEVALYPSLPSLARQYLWSINGTLDDRRGAPEAIGQWQGQPIAWGRLIGQDTQLKPGNVNNGPGLKTNEWAVQVGVDLWRSNSDWGQWRVGPVVSIGRSAGHAYNASGTVQTGRIGLNAYSLGLNATVATEAGAYVDLLLLGTRLTGVEASSPLGTVIATTGWAYSGSLEGGWRLPMTSKLAITPQAQLYSNTVNLNNATDAFSLIKMPSNTSLLGRLGVKLSYDKVDGLGPRTQFWARASVYNTLSGQDASTSFLNLAGTNPTTFQSRAPSTWMAIDAAVDVQATQNTSVQFGLGYQTSFNSQYRSVYGQVNVRIGF